MRSQEELKQILSVNPEQFEALCEMASWYYQECNFPGCFVMVERAITSYEATPDPASLDVYYDLKRLHTRLLHENMADLLGPMFPLADKRWSPAFKLGRLREIAWHVHDGNLYALNDALSSYQLRKLRYLYVTIDGSQPCVDFFLESISHRLPDTLRALNLQFAQSPTPYAFSTFWHEHQYTSEFAGLTAVTVAMPRLDDEAAHIVRTSLGRLSELNLASKDRTGMTPATCEEFADDPKSNCLTRLGIVGSCIGDEGLFIILSSDNFESLHTLDVHDGTLTNASCRVLHAEHNLSQLRHIDLRYNLIDPAGIDMIRRTSIEADLDGQHSRPV